MRSLIFSLIVLAGLTTHAEVCSRSKPVVAVMENALGKPCRRISRADLRRIVKLDFTGTFPAPHFLRSDFADLTNLKVLNLTMSFIESLDADVFRDLKSLEYLSLETNRLKTLEPGLFTGLVKLQSLYLDQNELTQIPAEIFDELISLKVLAFGNNPLTELPEGLFKRNIVLKDLSIEHTQISSLPVDLFQHMKALDIGMVYNFNLKQISEDVFAPLASMHGWCHVALSLPSDQKAKLNRRYNPYVFFE